MIIHAFSVLVVGALAVMGLISQLGVVLPEREPAGRGNYKIVYTVHISG